MFRTHVQENRCRAGSTLISAALHGGVAALLLTLAPPGMVEDAARRTASMATSLVAPYLPAAATVKRGGGGGGGGDNSPIPASKGRLPRIAPRQFAPPAATVSNEAPALLVEPTIVVAAGTPLPQVDMAVFGNPLGRIGPPSSGPGSGGGIGGGSGGGVGPGQGPGFGPGHGGGAGGGAPGGRGAITAAVPIYQVEPEYSDEARKAKVQGVVAIMVEIGADGLVRNPRLRSTLGLGLDEKAMEAVMKWRFRPYLQNGKPIAGPALIEVRFRLL
jgi:periplasmic protein TonB